MILDRIAGRPLVTLGLLVAASLLVRAPFLTVPYLDLDEAAQLLGSWELMRGGTLYVGFVDNRPPLLYAFYALAQALLGRGLPAVRLLVAVAVVPLAAFAASAFFRHDRRGIVAGLLYVVYGAGFLAHDMHSASPEVLMLLPLAAALVAVSSLPPGSPGGLRLLAAGVLLGVGALVRQHAVLWLPAFALAAWTNGERASATSTPGRLGRLLALVGGFVLPLAAVYAWFAARGAAGDLVFWTWTHDVRYARNPIPPGEALERATSYLLPFLVATAPLWWAAWLSRPGLGPRWRWLAAAAAGSLAGAFIGFRFFPHYFVPLYLPLALAAAPSTALALDRRGRAGRLAVAWPSCSSSASPPRTSSSTAAPPTSTRRRGPSSIGWANDCEPIRAPGRGRSSCGASRPSSTPSPACSRPRASWCPRRPSRAMFPATGPAASARSTRAP